MSRNQIVSESHMNIPTDGQLMDQLEAAFEKCNDGYVCMDLDLRRRLAAVLTEFLSSEQKACQVCSKPATTEHDLCGSEECLDRYRAETDSEF